MKPNEEHLIALSFKLSSAAHRAVCGDVVVAARHRHQQHIVALQQPAILRCRCLTIACNEELYHDSRKPMSGSSFGLSLNLHRPSRDFDSLEPESLGKRIPEACCKSKSWRRGLIMPHCGIATGGVSWQLKLLNCYQKQVVVAQMCAMQMRTKTLMT